MKGYQYLENDFFDLCKTREIGRVPMLLYIYLRGLFCRFQKPVFFCFDRQIKGHLGISQSTLYRARQYLEKRGVIMSKSGKGSRPTEYTMLGTILLPVIKKPIPPRHIYHQRYRHFDDSIKSKEREKNKVGEIFQGMSEEDRELLKKKGIL